MGRIRDVDNPLSRPSQQRKADVMLVPCHHTSTFVAPWPTEGQTVYCRRCVDYRTVGSVLKAYRCFCIGRRCRITRSVGDDIDAARRIASAHVLEHVSHAVEVTCNFQPVEYVRYGEDPSEHPYASIGGARQQVMRDVQENLRQALDRAYEEAQTRRVPPDGRTEERNEDDGHAPG